MKFSSNIFLSVSLAIVLTFDGVCSQVCQRPPGNNNVFFETPDSSAQACDPKHLVYDNEGCKECMYLDSKKIKTIGVGFNLKEASAAAVLAQVGADYNAIVNGPATAVKTPCNCSKVTCLNKSQIDEIFEISITVAIKDAQSALPTFQSLCCGVQNALVDMSFTLGGPTFRSFTTVLKCIAGQNWKAAADDLTTTAWCVVQATRRCTDDATAIMKGCGCSGQTKGCNPQASACCPNEDACCKGTATFSNNITKTFDEMLCCPHDYTECCPENKCCATGYPVCCPQNTCCQSAFPVCCPPDHCCASWARCESGQCVGEDGTIVPGIRANKKYSHHEDTNM